MSLIISIGFRNLVYRINIISKFNLKDAYSYVIREMNKYEIIYIRKFIHHHRRYFPNPTMKYKCIRHIKVRTRQNSKTPKKFTSPITATRKPFGTQRFICFKTRSNSSSLLLDHVQDASRRTTVVSP